VNDVLSLMLAAAMAKAESAASGERNGCATPSDPNACGSRDESTDEGPEVAERHACPTPCDLAPKKGKAAKAATKKARVTKKAPSTRRPARAAR